MKLLLKRIIGFFEFITGVILLSFFFTSLFFIDGTRLASLQWKDISGVFFTIVFGTGLIKYGWRWMFNIFDIIDEKELKTNDPYFKEATANAQLNIELFRGYLIKNIFDSSVLVSLNKNKKKIKRKWVRAEYLNSSSITISYYPSLISRLTKKLHKQILPLEEVEDWCIVRDDKAIGLYTIKALSDKAKNNGQNFNKRTMKLISRIIT